MPELVTREGTWDNVRRGDQVRIVVDGDEVFSYVTNINKKQLWATITVEDIEKPLRKRLSDPVVLMREQPTDAETEAKRKEFAHQLMVDALTAMLKQKHVDMLEEIVTKARQTDGDLGYNVLTWGNLPRILEVQAKHKVALRIVGFLDHSGLPHNAPAPSVTDATYDELIDAFAQWWIAEFENVLGSATNPLSRSTSTISNILDDLDEWANHQLTHEMWFYAIRKDVRRRAAEMIDEMTSK